MQLRNIVLAAALSLAGFSAHAGDFTNVPTRATPGPATLVAGGQNQATDKLYLEVRDTFVSPGVIIPGLSFADAAKLIPSSIDYNARATAQPRQVIATGVLTLLDYRVTNDITLPVVGSNGQPTGAADKIGDLYDFVFRDSRDDKLVFGTRILLGQTEEQLGNVGNSELNFVYRYGFDGFDAAAAWLFIDNDLRLYEAARTDSFSFTSQPYNEDVIRLKSDISVLEGNPFSGLYLIKTDAEFYTLDDIGVGYYQAGEEGQAVVGNSLAGFVPSNTPPVPEPSEYAMFLAGLGLICLVARRRMRA